MSKITLEDACKFKHLNKLTPATRELMVNASGVTQEYAENGLRHAVNNNLCKLARMLKESNFSESQATEAIHQSPAHRDFDNVEVDRAVTEVYHGGGTGGGDGISQSKWPQAEDIGKSEIRANMATTGIEAISRDDMLEQLGESPEEADNPTDFINHYFKGVTNPVYIGDRYTGMIEDVGTWLHLEEQILGRQYDQVLANPMKRKLTQEELKATVIDKDGKIKAKYPSGGRGLEFGCDDMEVITFECDKLTPEEQFAIITYLAQYLPLMAIVDAANKSYHATYSAKGLTYAQVLELRLILVSLGGDPGVMAPYQLVRLGGVNRSDKGNKFQEVIWINPDARMQSVDADKLAELVSENGNGFPEVHRNATDGKYWMENTHTQNWHVVNMQEMKEDLKAAGLSGAESSQAISKGRHENSVDGVLQLAGRSRGIFKSPRGNILVPSVKHSIEPKEGDWTVTKALIKGMFYGKDCNVMQYDVFMSWLARAWQSYNNEQITVAQFLHIAGDAGSYKTYLVEHVLAHLFGPISELNKNLTTEQQFNAHLFKGFLWVSDDADMPKYGKVDNELIKSVAVSSETCRCEGKNINAVSTPALRRGVMLTNTGTKAMEVVPVFEDGMNDKMICLYVHKFTLDVPGYNLPTEQSLKDALKSEAEAFAYVIENYEPPEWGSDNYADRYGVPSYKNPHVLEALRDMSPAGKNHDIIMKVVWHDYDKNLATEKTYTSSELLAAGSAALTDGRVGFFGWESPQTLGKTLAELEPLTHRFTKRGKGKNTKRWVFNRPEHSPFKSSDDELCPF